MLVAPSIHLLTSQNIRGLEPRAQRERKRPQSGDPVVNGNVAGSGDRRVQGRASGQEIYRASLSIEMTGKHDPACDSAVTTNPRRS
jgi:hypothetical protein